MPTPEATKERETPRAGESLLSVRGLAAGYHGIAVVRDLDLDVRAGEVVALLGSNGAGKTTTLLTIAGMLAPIGGTVRFDGADVGGVAAHRLARRGLSLVPENRALFHDLTTRENLRLARTRRGSEADVLDLLPELTKCLDRRAGLLSGGEQQMLAVGRALVSRPRLLVVDEMSLGLAPVVVQRLLPVLRSVADGFGTAVLVVEQHVTLALGVAERAYVLAHGRLALSGTSAELRTRPDLLTASYLGEAVADQLPDRLPDQTDQTRPADRTDQVDHDPAAPSGDTQEETRWQQG